jgi:Protein of unknown function (DUF2637)
MSADRDRYRTLTTLAVLLVAMIAAVVSYMHVATLAMRYGQPRLAAYLLPVSIDGLVAVSSLVMLRAARTGVTAPWLARTGLGLAVAATLARNVAFGLPHGVPGALLSGWPAVAFVVAAEMAISMTRKRAPAPRQAAEPGAPRQATTARPRSTTRKPKSRITDAATEARALAELARQPGLSGAELGRLLGASPRTGQRLLTRLNGRALQATDT